MLQIAALAHHSNLAELADKHLSVPTDKGANAGRKIGSLVTGMGAGAESIAARAIRRPGAMKPLFDHPSTASTSGSFLREFTFGHVRQLDAVASHFSASIDIDVPSIDTTATANEDPATATSASEA